MEQINNIGWKLGFINECSGGVLRGRRRELVRVNGGVEGEGLIATGRVGEINIL